MVSIYSISIIRSNIQTSLIALNDLLLNGSANNVLATGHDYRGTKRSNSSSEQSTENKSKCNDKCVHPHKLGHEIKIRAPVQHVDKINEFEKVNTNGINQMPDIQIIDVTYTNEVEAHINPTLVET